MNAIGTRTCKIAITINFNNRFYRVQSFSFTIGMKWEEIMKKYDANKNRIVFFSRSLVREMLVAL